LVATTFKWSAILLLSARLIIFLGFSVTSTTSYLSRRTRRSDNAVVAMLNLGVRDVFVDGTAQTIRYGSDLRIAPEYQGSRVLIYINRAVRECIQDTWYQSVILEENEKSRGALEGGRAGLPFLNRWAASSRIRLQVVNGSSVRASKKVRKALTIFLR
jgi:hypothetical protein